MAKKNEEAKKEEEGENVLNRAVEQEIAPLTQITQNYGSDDLNSLRDKINEIIKRFG